MMSDPFIPFYLSLMTAWCSLSWSVMCVSMQNRECDVDLDKLRLSTDPAFRTRLPFTLRKHAYSIILKILPPKNETFQEKKKSVFHISAQSTDCEYSYSMRRF